MQHGLMKSALLALTALTPAVAAAQSAAPAPADGGIQDIVVTARKVVESLNTAPISVSAVSSETIAKLGLNSIDDFAHQATGISFSQAFGRSSDRPVIRGQSNVLANVQFGVETGAAYFVDGIYYQGDIQGFDPGSLERVEVIKGPQSALYGRNTYAGAINYITKDPSSRLTASGKVSAAEHGEYQVMGSLSGQLAEGLGFRLGGRHFEYGGQYTNQLTGKTVGQEKTDSLFATLVMSPTTNLKMRFRAQYEHDRDGSLAIFLQGASANNCMPGFRSARYRTTSSALPFVPNLLGPSTNTNQYFCGAIQPQPNGIRLNTDPVQVTIPAFAVPGIGTRALSGVYDGTAFDGIENKQTYLSNVIDWDVGGSGFVVSSLTGFRTNVNRFGADSDHSESYFFFNLNPAFGGAYPTLGVDSPAFANTNIKHSWDISQELRLSTPVNKPVHALVGLYYFKQRQTTQNLSFANPVGGDAYGVAGSALNVVEDKAIFGAVTLKPTKSLSITAEARYAKERKQQIDFTSAPVFCAGYAGATNPFGSFTAANCQPEYKENGTDPRVTVNYTTSGGTLLYAIFARGHKPGGFNGSAGATATAQTGQNFINYLPEKAQSFEFGTKFDAIDKHLRIALAAYHNKLTNVQLTTAIPNPSGSGAITSIVTNQGNGLTQGFELEFTAAPSKNLTINGGLSYVDAHFTSGCDSDLFILNTGGIRPNFDTRNPTAAGLGLCDITGKRLPLGSPWIVNGAVNYVMPVGEDSVVTFNTNFSYEASKFVQTYNLAKTGTTFLLNARLAYRFRNFTLTAFGRNLTNEDSIPLATRWFDYRYGAGTTGLPAAASVTFDGRAAQIETGAPRAFFGTLRKGRTFGAELAFNF